MLLPKIALLHVSTNFTINMSLTFVSFMSKSERSISFDLGKQICMYKMYERAVYYTCSAAINADMSEY